MGDLAPLELQGLANMRAQLDLNVTSFAYLTARLLGEVLGPAQGAGGGGVHSSSSGGGEGGRSSTAHLQSAAAGAAGDAVGPPPGSGAAATSAVPSSEPSIDNGRGDVAGGDADSGRPTPTPTQAVTIVNISSVSAHLPFEHFSVYGAGKAARHMLIRCVALEAQQREVAAAADATAASAPASAGGRGALPPPRVRALSYAPGAIDTEMQAAAREALPPGPLKASFERNHREVSEAGPRPPRGVPPPWAWFLCLRGGVGGGRKRGLGGGGGEEGAGSGNHQQVRCGFRASAP